MSFLIKLAPFFAIASWDFFRFDRNFFAVCFGDGDLRRIFIAFCRSGSVGLTVNIFFADFLFGFKRNASIPALATFSAPWIFMDFISVKILLN